MSTPEIPSDKVGHDGLTADAYCEWAMSMHDDYLFINQFAPDYGALDRSERVFNFVVIALCVLGLGLPIAFVALIAAR